MAGVDNDIVNQADADEARKGDGSVTPQLSGSAWLLSVKCRVNEFVVGV